MRKMHPSDTAAGDGGVTAAAATAAAGVTGLVRRGPAAADHGRSTVITGAIVV